MAMDAPVPVSKRKVISASLVGPRIASGCAATTWSTNKRRSMLTVPYTYAMRRSATRVLEGACQLVSQTCAGNAQLHTLA
jgi:hypothetical protein